MLTYSDESCGGVNLYKKKLVYVEKKINNAYWRLENKNIFITGLFYAIAKHVTSRIFTRVEPNTNNVFAKLVVTSGRGKTACIAGKSAKKSSLQKIYTSLWLLMAWLRSSLVYQLGPPRRNQWW